MSSNLKKLTPGEKLWLRRRALGFTQEEAAAHCGVCEKIYWEAEQDKTYLNGKLGAPKPNKGDLCALARRRHGLTLVATATLMGCSKVTLLKREAASDPALIKAWRALGYQF